MILGKLRFPTDNVWAQQYVLAEAGIRHADLDVLYPCEECTYEEALLINCNIVKRVLFRETFDCSLEYSSANPVSDTKNKHIDVDEAYRKCKHLLGRKDSTAWQSKFFTEYRWDRSA